MNLELCNPKIFGQSDFLFMENQEEIWRDVVGSDGFYQISSFGRLRSMQMKNNTGGLRNRKEPLYRKFSKNSDGYFNVSITIDGIDKTVSVHRLVGIHFVENPNNLPEINHKDGNKQNNHCDNLEWATRSWNVKHAYDNKLKFAVSGDRNKMATITNEIAIEIASSDASIKDLATKYGVTTGIVYKIKNGGAWRSVTGVEKKAGKRLTYEEVFEILNSKETGYSISKRTGISASVICEIRNGRAYRKYFNDLNK